MSATISRYGANMIGANSAPAAVSVCRPPGDGSGGSSRSPCGGNASDVLRYNGGSSVATGPGENIVLAAAHWAAVHGGKR